MASEQIRTSGIDPTAKADGKSGYNVDPGPYEAIVIQHVNGTRMGQLQVYIPDWGGLQTDPNNQIVVSYASPFYGTTFGTDTQMQSLSSSATTGQSYGFWCVPPDIGNKVLVTFAAGDKNRGYWFACIYDSPSHHMVPGIGRNIGTSENTVVDAAALGSIGSSLNKSSNLPVSEYSTGSSTSFNADGLVNTRRFAHPYQTAVLVKQGLSQDPVRGAISSSSMRESPSNVYGISTPGRSMTKGKQTNIPGEVGEEAVLARIGGHTFVMDDGDKDGNDRLIRLRTSGGHQILMNDVADGTGVLYVASASGMQWLEFSSDGCINVYGRAGINMRTEGVLNLQGDAAVIINSAGGIKLNGDMGVSVTSAASVSISSAISASMATDGILSLSGVGTASLSAGGLLNLNAVGYTNINGALIKLNSPTYMPKPPSIVLPPVPNMLPDVTWGGSNWVFQPGALQSACTIAPAHEPWLDPNTNRRPTHAKATSSGTGFAINATASVVSSLASKFF